MRQKNEPLPSKEEAIRETKKRDDIVKRISGELRTFCESMIIVGSTAFGKNYSVRKSSDIDIILLMHRRNADKILSCPLITMTPKYEEAITYFLSGEVDHFSINTEKIDDVETQYHFWDIEAHFNMFDDKTFIPKAYNVWRTQGEYQGRAVDFTGNELSFTIPTIKKCQYGVIHDYPADLIINGKYIIRQPVNNFITDPEIIFSKDKRLESYMSKTWDIIAKNFIKEKTTYNKENPISFIFGNWNFSPESRKRTIIEEKFRQALIKQGLQP